MILSSRSCAGVHRQSISAKRKGFTLVELLVVISIILTLTAVTVASFSYSINADRVRSAARQFQSFLAGARDKAIYANEVRGVRLLLDPNDNHAVSGMQYIGSPKRESGLLKFYPIGTTPPFDTSGRTVFLVPNSGVSWASLKRRGFLTVGGRIQIPAGTGSWYTISAIGPAYSTVNDLTLTLNASISDLANSPNQVAFNLELSAGILGDSQPVLFPRGVVIDLDGSRIPWQAASLSYPTNTPTASYPNNMDILFTPRGTVVGDAIGKGMLHFHFADAYDVARWHSPAPLLNQTTQYTTPYSYRTTANYSPNNSTTWPIVPADPAGASSGSLVVTRDRILASLSVRTGNVSVHYVNTGGATLTSPAATDPFLFAETGQVANK